MKREKLKAVHFTKPFFSLRSIEIKNGGRRYAELIKPVGGLWCSPLDSKYGWRDWCQGRSDFEHDQCVIFDVDMSNFVVIDSAEDMKTRLPWILFADGHSMAIDFEKMVHEGVDGIHLTENGLVETEFTYPESLYGWDCETILILNDRCIKSTET